MPGQEEEEEEEEAGVDSLEIAASRDGPLPSVERIDGRERVGGHNQRQASESLMVHLGDLIFEVNGVFGDSAELARSREVGQRLVLGIASVVRFEEDARPLAELGRSVARPIMNCLSLSRLEDGLAESLRG